MSWRGPTGSSTPAELVRASGSLTGEHLCRRIEAVAVA